MCVSCETGICVYISAYGRHVSMPSTLANSRCTHENIMQQICEAVLNTICSGYGERLWMSPQHVASLALFRLRGTTLWVALLLTALRSVLVHACFSKLAVSIELVILLVRLVHTLWSHSFMCSTTPTALVHMSLAAPCWKPCNVGFYELGGLQGAPLR